MLEVLLLLTPQAATAPAAAATAPAAKDTAPAAAEEEEKPALAFEIGNVWLTPFLGPSYTPEMGLIIGGGLMLSFKADQGSPRSTLTATLSYGTVGAGQVVIRLESYYNDDHLRVTADIDARLMNDNYFGVGYDNGSTVPLGPNTTGYTRAWFQLKPTLSLQIANRLFFGGTFDLNGTRATDLNPMMAADPTITSQGTDFLNVGFGPVLEYDSRDVPQNAYRGLYFKASYLFYREGLGKNDTYSILGLDYKQYKELGRPGQILAWHVRVRNATGDVPWPELPSIGGSVDLRGYRAGQYRDNSYMYGLVEYRHTFTAGTKPDGTPRLSKHGFVVWAGLGVLGPDLLDPSPPLVNFGVGYRFAIQGRLALRLDLGFGRFESQGGYLSFGEAF
jgi:hypothetical protein